VIHQQLNDQPGRTHDAEHGWSAPSEHFLPLIDLDDDFFRSTDSPCRSSATGRNP
jgi:hypothetical protein